MFGRILGKLAAAPMRLANLPLALTDKMSGGDGDPAGLREMAQAIEDEIAESLGDEDES